MAGAWAHLVNIDGSDEHLKLCEEALAEVKAEERRRLEEQHILVPKKGRFLAYDGTVHRVKDMWLERSGSQVERWGVVVWKPETTGS